MSLHLYFFRGKGIRLFLFQVTSGVSFLKRICRLSLLTVRSLVSQSWNQVLVLFFFWVKLHQVMCSAPNLPYLPGDVHELWGQVLGAVFCSCSPGHAVSLERERSGLGCLCRFCARHFPPVCCGRMKEDLFMLSFHCGRCFTAYYCFPARS